MLIRCPDKERREGRGEEQFCAWENCGHPDCADLRSKVLEKCAVCRKALGLDREFRENPDGLGSVHQSCIDRDSRVTVSRNVFVRQHTTVYCDQVYRLFLSCGHEEVVRLRERREEGRVVSKPKMPKTVHCLTCAKLKRDQYGRKRADADWIKPPPGAMKPPKRAYFT